MSNMRRVESTVKGGGSTRGFTLIELIVVMTILGLALALALPALQRAFPWVELNNAARTTMTALRETRGRAIGSNREIVLYFDLSARRLSIDGARPVSLDPRLGMTLTTATREVIRSGVGSGVRGPILQKWIEQLLADHDVRVKLDRERDIDLD